jgi:macrolide transport system ATP-binding/permease protein
MKALRAAITRLFGFLQSDRRERDLADELDAHLQLHVDDNLRAGMSPEEARRIALLKLGGLEQTKEHYRERSTVPMIEHTLQDVRFALRQLIKSPGFAVTSIVMLALGSGSALAIFGFVDAALLRPLPYREPARLVNVTESTPQIPRANLSYFDYLDWKRMNTVFSSLDVHHGRRYALTTAGGTELVPGARVSDGFFRTLGVDPAIGRDFRAGEDLPGAPPTVILSHSAWQVRFGGRNDAVGQPVVLDGVARTIIGVLPESFHFALRGRVDFWTPIDPTGLCEKRRSCHNLTGVARLKDSASPDAAFAEMRTIAANLERAYPDSNRSQGASVLPLSEVIVGPAKPVLFLLLAGAALLLAIACVNVAGLLIVRSETRRRELAVRSALGASNARLVCQFVTEAVVLVGLGSAFGLVVARLSMTALSGLIPDDMLARLPYFKNLGLTANTVAMAALLALGATIVLSLAPLPRLLTGSVRDGLTEGGRGGGSRTWRRLGFKLVVVELATAVVLLSAAGLLGKSLYRLLNASLGFQPDHLSTVYVTGPASIRGNNDRAVAFAHGAIERVRRLPGVESVGLVSVLPVSFNGNTTWIRFVGRPYNGEHNEVNEREVSAGFFETLRAKLIRGRFFSDADGPGQPLVTIINQTFARKYFPGEDPIGKRIGNTDLAPQSIQEIVGVVDDIREGSLDSEIWPAIYHPFPQDPDGAFALVARTAQDDGSMLPSVVAALREVDQGVGTIGEATMSDRISDSPVAYLQRSSTILVGGFAAAALLLGVIGLYGVIDYSVSQRTRELGVRLAMGAQRRTVYRMILREAGNLAFVGVAIGLAGSVGAGALMRRLLIDTAPWDVTTLTGVAVVLGLAALLASFLPARRAASVDPIEALRSE